FEFWTHSKDSAKDQAMLKQLYECGCLRTIPESNENIENQFWNAFHHALDCNIRGTDGKRRKEEYYL
ncbi:4941_t:CDS:1, partial [Gigaspora rosea]